MVFKDYYKILELKTNKISTEEIKNAYRMAVKKNHPDLNLKNKLAEEKIKDINEAYRILSDATAKRKYDRIWTRNNNAKKQQEYKDQNKKANSVFGEFFGMFFGNLENKKDTVIKKYEKNPIKGENIETSIDVDIEEVFYGLDKKISLRTTDGKMKVYTVAIPAGIRNVKNNDKFTLKGNDLYTNLYLAPWEAALGTKTEVYSIDEESTLFVPSGIETGEMLKIEGKGYKDGKGSRGDLFVKVNIMVPKKLSNEEKELFKKLSTISNFNPRNS